MSDTSVFRSVRRPERRRAALAVRLAKIVVALVVVAVLATFAYLVFSASRALDPQQLPTLALNETDPDAVTDQVEGTRVTLVVGVDRRQRPPAEIAEQAVDPRGAAVTDSIMLLQTSPRRAGTAVVTFPTGLQVDPPGVVGSTRLDHVQALGGPDLLLTTVQDLTGIPVDHWVELDLAGVVDVVDAVGGVEVCLDDVSLGPEPAADGEPAPSPGVSPTASETGAASPSDRDPGAGCQLLDGAAAAGFMASRSDADIALDQQRQRLAEQHYLLARVLDRATQTSTLANPLRTNRVLQALPRAVASDVDPGLRGMFRVANDVADFDRDELIVRVVPSYRTGTDGEVQLYPDQAVTLFSALQAGRDLADVGQVTTDELGPSDVRVLVVNGVGEEGLASQAATYLEQRDFVVAGAINPSDIDPRDDWDPTQRELVLEFVEGDEVLVDILAEALGDLPVQRVPVERIPPGATDYDPTVILTVGAAWNE